MKRSELKAEKGAVDWRFDLGALAGIVLLGIITYAHTLKAPWYMDDLRAIVENPSVQSLRLALSELFTASRGIADLTFALNYRFGGTDVVGYHLVNIAIHLITSYLVYLLFKRVFRDRLLLAFGGALIFVAHPLQTQAVTYIVQRMTSLAALFFFMALFLYVRARETESTRQKLKWCFYCGALFSGALAVMVKQNTAVLPVAILLFERYFLAEEQQLSKKELFWQLAPFALVPAWLALTTLLPPIFSPEGIINIGGLPDLVHLQHSSPLNYLVTEFSVVWIYLRLLLFPVGQALDYDYPIVASIWEVKSLIAFCGIAVLLAGAAILRKRLPYISAAIFWFFLTLMVESTFIPLDPVFEHRLYIPMFGFALLVIAGFARPPRRFALVAGVLMLTALASLTWNRNNLWNDPVAFHEDNLRRAPRSERVHLDLANVYRKQGRLAEAQSLYERALKINPDYVLLHINLSLVYTAQSEHMKAVNILREGLRRNPSHFKLYNNLGVLYNFLAKYEDAVIYLQKGAAFEPNNATVQFNLGMAHDRLGHLDEAIKYYRESIKLNPANPESYFNLGTSLFKQGKDREALHAFLTVSRLNPAHPGSLFNAALIYLKLKDLASANNMVKKLQKLDPEKAQKLHLRILKESQ